MKKAVVSLSFDDGREDNWDIFQEILIPMSIPATINVSTGYVDGSCPQTLAPTDKPAITVADVQQLASNPLFEIAMHGDCHLNTEEDIAVGREKLITWLGLPENHRFGFASPGSGLRVEEFVNSKAQLFAEQTSYMRTSLRIKKYPTIRVLCRKIGRVLHIPFLYQIAYADTLMDYCEDRVVYSIPIMKDATYEQVKRVVDLAISRRCALTLMFHSILEETAGEDNWSWNRNHFMKLCQYLKDKEQAEEVELLTTGQMLTKLQG